MADKPRTFKQIVAAESPAERARWERAGHYKDLSVEDDFHAGVWVIEKLEGDGWVVQHQNDDGAMFMAIFEGQEPEARARDYFEALKTGLIETIRNESDPGQPPGKDEFHGDLCLIERRLTGDWFVEREDSHLTTFAGPAAERRARDYFEALKTGKLPTL